MVSDQIAAALGVEIEKLEALMYALVHIGYLELTQGRFSNSPDADHFLVRGKPNYLGDMYEAMPQRWEAAPTASFFSWPRAWSLKRKSSTGRPSRKNEVGEHTDLILDEIGYDESTISSSQRSRALP